MFQVLRLKKYPQRDVRTASLPCSSDAFLEQTIELAQLSAASLLRSSGLLLIFCLVIAVRRLMYV